MAYRAEIEIGVQGAQRLKELQDRILKLSRAVEEVNVKQFIDNKAIQSVAEYTSALSKSAATLKETAIQLNAAGKASGNYENAISQYVTTLGQQNTALRLQNRLINEEIELRRKQKLAQSGIVETAQYTGPIGPGAASSVLGGQSSKVDERIRRALDQKRDELELEQALLRLEEKSAAVANRELQTRGEIARLTARGVNAATFRAAQAGTALALPAFQERGLQLLDDSVRLNASNLRIETALNGERQRGARFLEKQTAEEARQVQLGILGQRTNRLPGQRGAGFAFPTAGPVPLELFGAQRKAQGSTTKSGGRGRLGGIASNAIIGGAFPLLFGQGGGAATGGAIGGAVGGLFGGAGGFAGSLLGTLLGQIAGQGNQVKELAADIGFSAQQTQILGTAFKQAGADFDKFAESVSRIQGIGLALEEQASAIQLASTLTESYGGKIDKVTNAFTNALQTGKVTQATLNQLTSQGVPIQDALANKYNVSRDALLQMAKDGKISVQDLLDTLVNLANESVKGPAQTSSAYKEAFDQISLAVDNLTDKIVASFNFQSDAAGKAGDNLAYRVAGAFTQILKALEPVIELLAQTSGAFVNLGVQAVNALAGIPNMIGSVANAIIGMIPGLGSAYSALSLIANLTGKGRKQGVATPINLNQGMEANWPEGVPRPGTSSPIARIMAPGQMPPSGGGRGKADKAANDATREAERVAKLLRDTQAQTELLKIQAGLQDKIFQAEQAKDPFLVAKLQGEERILQIQARYAELIANEPNIRAQEALVTKGLQEIENSRLQTAQAFEKIESERLEKYNTLIEDLNLELELKNLTTEQDRERLRIEFEVNRLRKENIFTEEQLLEIQRKRLALAAQDSPGQKRMKELSTSLAELTNTENLAVAAADNIGVAFSQAFQDIANGASSGQEAIANMMKSIGENFVNMAAQIIAQQITMVILGTILKALGISGGFGSAGASGANAGGISGSSLPGGFSNPLVGQYSSPLANGGPAVGGTPYLVGERGPELFVPGTSGGVMSNNDLRQSMNGGGSPVLNMSFETTRFGDTEYVSRDQLEAAMSETRRQASRDGAQRGMTMTLDRLQQSPRTRSRLGMR